MSLFQSFLSMWSTAPPPLPAAPAATTGPSPLDICEVYQRVLIMGLPGMGPTSRDTARNNVNELVAHLDARYGRGRYLVFNLAPERKVMYDAARLHSQVLRFAPLLDDNDSVKVEDGGLLGLGEAFRICYTMHFFLSWSRDHVVILHDDRKRGRSLHVAACYLAWAHSSEFMDTLHAYSHVLRARGLPDARAPLPTWRSMLKSFQTCVQQPIPMLPARLQLEKIVVSMAGDISTFDTGVVVEVFQDDEVLFDSRDRAGGVGSEELTSTPSSSSISLTLEEGGEADSGVYDPDFIFTEGTLRCAVHRLVQGDIQIHISAEVVRRRDPHVVPTPAGDLPDMSSVEGLVDERIERKLVMRYAFHTSLMPLDAVSAIILSAKQVDLPCPSLVTQDGFAMQMTLANPDPAAAAERDAQVVRERLRAVQEQTGAQLDSPPPPLPHTPGPHSAPVSAAVRNAVGMPLVASMGGSAGSGNANAAAPSSTTTPAKGVIDWSFASMLCMQGRYARLAGLYNLANAHSIIPEQYSIDMLTKKGVREYFAILALQLSERNLDHAETLLRSDYLHELSAVPASPRAIIDAATTAYYSEQAANNAAAARAHAAESATPNGPGRPADASPSVLVPSGHVHDISRGQGLLSPLVEAVAGSRAVDAAGGSGGGSSAGSGGGYPPLDGSTGATASMGSATRSSRAETWSPPLSSDEFLQEGPLMRLAFPVICTVLANAAESSDGGATHASSSAQLARHENANRFLLRHVGDLSAGVERDDAETTSAAEHVPRAVLASPDPPLYYAALQLAAAVKAAEAHLPASPTDAGSPETSAWLHSLQSLDAFKMRTLLMALRDLSPFPPPPHSSASRRSSLQGITDTLTGILPSRSRTSSREAAAQPDVATRKAAALRAVMDILGHDARLGDILAGLHRVNPSIPDATVRTPHAALPATQLDSAAALVAATQAIRSLLAAVPAGLASAGTNGPGSGEGVAGSSGDGSGSGSGGGSASGGDNSRPGISSGTATTAGNAASSTSATTIAPTSAVSSVAPAPAPADATPDLSKYEKMLKMGVPSPAVRQKMRGEGVPDDVADAFMAKQTGASAAGAPPAENDEWKRQKVEKEKAAAAAAASASDAAAKDAAAAAARAERIAKLRQEQRDMVADALAPVGTHVIYGRFFRMLHVGVPREVVAQKMVSSGMDASILTLDAEKPLPDVQLRPLREDALYGKFLRMAKMGIPRDAVEHKMAAEKANPLALELEADLPLPPSLNEVSGESLRSPGAAPRPAAAIASARPKRQRKRLHWDALPTDRITKGATIWADASRALEESDDDDFIDDEFEKLFTQDVTGARSTLKPAKHASPAGKTVYVIDLKRGRNVGIGLAKLRMGADAIRHALMGLTLTTSEGATLSHEALILLEELLPTPEEVSQVKSHRGDKARLGEAEHFFLAVGDIPKSRARASALAFQRQFDPRAEDVAARLAIITRACEQVRVSKRLRKVLEVTLKLGNRLNAADAEEEDGEGGHSAPGTPAARGGGRSNVVQGFTLNSLLKLGQTKAFNSNITALHYLVKALARRDPDALQLGADMMDAPLAARLTLEIIRSDIGGLKTGLMNVEKLVREQTRMDGSVRARAGTSARTSEMTTSGHGLGMAAAAAAATAAVGVHDSVGAASGSPLHSRGPEFVGDDTAPGTSASPPRAASEGERMLDFVARAQARIAQLVTDLEATQSAFNSVLTFFGEDEHMNAEMFFTTLTNFIRAMDRARIENSEEEARKAREARRAAAAATPQLARSLTQPARMLTSALAAAVRLPATASAAAAAASASGSLASPPATVLPAPEAVSIATPARVLQFEVVAVDTSVIAAPDAAAPAVGPSGDEAVAPSAEQLVEQPVLVEAAADSSVVQEEPAGAAIPLDAAEAAGNAAPVHRLAPLPMRPSLIAAAMPESPVAHAQGTDASESILIDSSALPLPQAVASTITPTAPVASSTLSRAATWAAPKREREEVALTAPPAAPAAKPAGPAGPRVVLRETGGPGSGATGSDGEHGAHGHTLTPVVLSPGVAPALPAHAVHGQMPIKLSSGTGNLAALLRRGERSGHGGDIFASPQHAAAADTTGAAAGTPAAATTAVTPESAE